MALEAQDNPFPYVTLVDTADPSTPAAGTKRLWVDTDDTLKIIDESDVVTSLVGGGIANPLATDSLWDAAGDLVVGSGANTAAKLTMGAEGSALTIMDGVVGWNGATSMPSGPTTGQRCWRSDLSSEFVFDGTQWVSTDLHHLATSLDNENATTAYGAPSTTMGGFVTLGAPALAGGSDIWLVGVSTNFFVNGGTALAAGHNWVVTINKRPTNNSDTTLVTVTINSGSSSVWRNDVQAIGALMNNGTTHYVIGVSATKMGTPGPLFVHCDLYYRIVAT